RAGRAGETQSAVSARPGRPADFGAGGGGRARGSRGAGARHLAVAACVSRSRLNAASAKRAASPAILPIGAVADRVVASIRHAPVVIASVSRLPVAIAAVLRIPDPRRPVKVVLVLVALHRATVMHVAVVTAGPVAVTLATAA